MAKLNICGNYLTVVLHQDFLAFSFGANQRTWKFDKVVKCLDNVKSSDGSIECCAFSPCGKYFGACFDKNIIIFNTFDWNLLHISPGERKASSLKFFPKSRVVLLADKSGRASFYSFGNEGLEKNELTLGHNSMLTSALITDDEKYIITSDRDEKIRITNYPNVYNIEKYCLGHKMFVSCIDFLPGDKRILISGSGDGTIRCWDYISGKELAVYDCNASNRDDDNLKTTITKFVTCKQDCISLVAVLEYKSNLIRILTVNGNLIKGLKVELLNVVKLKFNPWDICFYYQTLVCLLPDHENPLMFWSSNNNVTEVENSFKGLKEHLIDNWEPFVSMSHKISDEVPVLFKREVDNLNEYEKRKKARLLKTGKTS